LRLGLIGIGHRAGQGRSIRTAIDHEQQVTLLDDGAVREMH
jgi:hypothetical protein